MDGDGAWSTITPIAPGRSIPVPMDVRILTIAMSTMTMADHFHWGNVALS